MIPNVDTMVPNAFAATGGGGTITIGSTPVLGGSGNNILYDNAGTIGEVTLGANLTFSGGVLSATSGAGIVVNTTTITGGTSGHVVYDNAGTVGEAANFTISSGNPNVSSGNAYLYNGVVAIQALTSLGFGNWYFGHAGNLSTTAHDDLGIGAGALAAANAGTTAGNIAIGTQALNLATNADGNTAVGFQALSGVTTSVFNTAIGWSAMGSATGGHDNVAVGLHTLNLNTTGTGNSALGSNALSSNTSGQGNSADGSASMQHNTTGQNNFAMGAQSLFANIDGSNNVAIGFQAVSANDHGGSNVGIGFTALGSLLGNPSSNNVAIGANAGNSLASGSDAYNTFIGFKAGDLITAGNGNVIIGANIAGPATLNHAILIGTGDGILHLDFAFTNAGAWTLDQAILFASSQALTNSAGANTATLTNAPVAGNPTKWVTINDNGTNRFVPAW